MIAQPTYRRIIHYIHLAYRDSMRPFAIHEVAYHTKLSTSTVTRVLRTLVELKLLMHRPAMAGRNYRVAARWSRDVADVIELYETFKMVTR